MPFYSSRRRHHPRTYETTGHRRRTWGRGRREPLHRPPRHTSIRDKVSGALLKLKGSITRNPGTKAAGTRRMRGTDGKGQHYVRKPIFSRRRHHQPVTY